MAQAIKYNPNTLKLVPMMVWGLYLIAWAIGDRPWTLGSGLLLISWAWLACISGNVYIVGLNQIEDVAIDRVNKPHLPLASGEFSHQAGQMIVAIAGILAVAIAALSQGPFLLATVGLSLLIGTAYSRPPLRLKRFPFWASVCILSVRGMIVNLGLFLHYHQQLGGRVLIPGSVWALTLFILVFSFAIAIFKDIPDLEGDRQYNITTFTVRLGQQAVFNLARWVLTACYLGMVLFSTLIPGVNTSFLVVTHLAAIAWFWYLSFKVNLRTHPRTGVNLSYPQLYQFIWKLFFVEYLIFPMACFLGRG
ncbi:MAG: homogentisate phytyltransferase [Cyanothece sp. SIO1E1]|nr:homogentisate phytyltransferase [Cyanothece sp. SIO1E1]